MKPYTNFLAYASMKKSESLRLLLFDCIAFHNLCRCMEHGSSLPYGKNNHVSAIDRFGEWLCDGSYETLDEAKQIAGDACQAASEAVVLFRKGEVKPDGWGLDFQQYVLFNKICNSMSFNFNVFVLNALMDFGLQHLNLKDRENNALEENNDVELNL